MKITDITCVSDLYYVIGHWFTLGMVALAFSALPVALEIWDSLFSFLMCAGIAFVGVAAEYQDRSVYPVHVGAACISMVCSVVWVSVVNPWCLLGMLVGLLGFLDRSRWLLWLELGYFLSVGAAMIFTV